jgi:3-phosphoshikimate 1-carboxyvinyltransferase
MTQHEYIDLPPLLSAAGTVRMPGSKSISNRVLLLAALSEGVTCCTRMTPSACWKHCKFWV